MLTHLPPTVLDTETIAGLYRVRWQVELYIKRLKSLLDLDRLRPRQGGALAEVYLYGKLLFCLVLEKLAGKRFGDRWGRLDRKRRGTGWRIWQLLKQAIDTAIMMPWQWRLERYDQCRNVMMERSRKRSLQTLPELVVGLLEWCRRRELSNT